MAAAVLTLYLKHSCKWLYQDCKCDVNCDIFKDCCSDANASNADTTPEMTEKLREVAPFIRCDYVPEVYNRWFIFVVNSCPNDADKIVQYLCQNIDSENIISRTPVVGNVTRLLYRNLYCAVCNNEPYTLLNPQLSCSWETPYEGNHTIEELVKMEECTVKYFSTNFYEFATKTLRSCYHTISECTNLSADDIHQEECKSGRNEYVFTTDNIYVNKGCYYCSEEHAYGERASCSMNDIYNDTLPTVKIGKLYSYRMLFDLENKILRTEKRAGIFSREHEDFPLDNDCLDTQVFDPFANVCRDILCTSGFKYNGVKCLAGNASMWRNSYCTEIQFSGDEYEIVTDTSIFVFASKKTYPEVIFVDDVAHVCISVRTSAIFLHKNDPIESWLSFLCGIVSVVCLLMSAMVYMLPKLQNRPGRLLLSLSVCLCIAQILFLVAPRAEINSAVCKTVGILDHFFFLASFLWMNVMSFDIYKTFSSAFYSVENNQKHFAFYSLYAWGSSLCITSAGILTDDITTWSFRPKYGVGACWITNTKGLIVFFLVPGALLIILNSIFFVLSVRSICVTKRRSSATLQKKSTCDLLIYIKLSTVMGLTWIFGFVATWANNKIFWYLFIIFNGLQGLFIFLSFVLNKNVYRAVRQCFGFPIAETKRPTRTSSSQPIDNLTAM